MFSRTFANRNPGARPALRRQDRLTSARPSGAVKLPILPLDLDGRRLPKRLDPPRLGAQTGEVLAGLGYSAAEIDAMAAAGTIRRG